MQLAVAPVMVLVACCAKGLLLAWHALRPSAQSHHQALGRETPEGAASRGEVPPDVYTVLPGAAVSRVHSRRRVSARDASNRSTLSLNSLEDTSVRARGSRARDDAEDAGGDGGSDSSDSNDNNSDGDGDGEVAPRFDPALGWHASVTSSSSKGTVGMGRTRARRARAADATSMPMRARCIAAAANFGLTAYSTLTTCAVRMLHCVEVPGSLAHPLRLFLQGSLECRYCL